MKKKILLILLICNTVLFRVVMAQELNCNIRIITPKLNIVDPRVFQSLEKELKEFMNNRKWTSDNYKQHERIDISYILTITEEISVDKFRATLQIQSSRPVFNTSYKSVLLNYLDKDFEFNYTENTPMLYNDQEFISNLTSVFAFYAFITLGLDYDSYINKGGTIYFQKAQNIVSYARNSDVAGSGWRPFDSNKNRYWMVENILNIKFESVRNSFYTYHINGLDKLQNDINSARANMLIALQGLEKVSTENQNLYGVQVLVQAKTDEIINIYQKSNTIEKNKIVNIMSKIDPSNFSKYQNILK